MKRDKGEREAERGQEEDEEISDCLVFFFQYKSRRTKYSGQFQDALAKLANHRSTDDGLGRSDPKLSEHFLLSKTLRHGVRLTV